jgi:hypothetical protein
MAKTFLAVHKRNPKIRVTLNESEVQEYRTKKNLANAYTITEVEPKEVKEPVEARKVDTREAAKAAQDANTAHNQGNK